MCCLEGQGVFENLNQIHRAAQTSLWLRGAGPRLCAWHLLVLGTEVLHVRVQRTTSGELCLTSVNLLKEGPSDTWISMPSRGVALDENVFTMTLTANRAVPTSCPSALHEWHPTNTALSSYSELTII